MKKAIMLFLMMIGIVLGLSAQTARFAYVWTHRVLAESNDTREAERIYASDRDTWNSQVEDLAGEVRRLESDYEIRRLTLSDTGKAEAEAQIAAKRREAQQLLESLFGENGLAERRNAELLAPIVDKMTSIINRIAEDDNYTMVLDASTGVFLYANDRMNITQQVIDEMNRAN